MIPIEIKEVVDSSGLKEFLRLPDKIYFDKYPRYVKPLDAHTKMMIGKIGAKAGGEKKHLFLGLKDGVTVARAGFKIHSHDGEGFLHFGFFECAEGESEVAIKIFDKARELYPSVPMKGPYHFRMEDPYVGNLIYGFERDPYIFMPHNPPYYDEYLLKCRLKKSMDLLTYEFVAHKLPPQLKKIAERSRKKGLEIRWINPKRLKDEVKIVASIFNEALSDNWGFEPITDDQLDEMFLTFKFFIDPRAVVFVVDKEGREVGCLIMLPNLNYILKKARGRLSLGLIWKLFTQRRKYDSIRGYALGMRKQFQGSGMVCQLIEAVYERCVGYGSPKCEISWVLENNRPMTALSESIGGVHAKTYRVYEST